MQNWHIIVLWLAIGCIVDMLLKPIYLRLKKDGDGYVRTTRFISVLLLWPVIVIVAIAAIIAGIFNVGKGSGPKS